MRLPFALALLAFSAPALLVAAPSAQEPWRDEISSDGSRVAARHESGAVVVAGKLLVLGGRGSKPVNRYDAGKREWSSLGAAPQELHHFQPVAIGSKIYVIGALTGSYPDELAVDTVHVLDTSNSEWSIAGQIPADRLRGSTTAVVYGGDIYLSGGNTRGHDGGAVAWFDRFDPASGKLTPLPDAPHERDHASAVVIGSRLYVAGGRTSDLPNPFDKPVLPVDIYDFTTNEWSTGADIPTARAGAVNAAVGDEIIVAGGEINTSASALARVEAYNSKTDSWRRLADLNTGRHSGGGAVLGDRLHLVAGSLKRGGGNSDLHESLALDGPIPTDSDGDGLDDDDEEQIYGTDPTAADTDDDGLEDGDEIERNTDPQVADTDEDGLEDGEEVITYGTDPLRSDTDNDDVSDGDEVAAGTDPLVADDVGSGTAGDTAGDGSTGGDAGTDTGADTEGEGTSGSGTGDATAGGTTGTTGDGADAGTGGETGDQTGGETGGETSGNAGNADSTGGDTTAGETGSTTGQVDGDGDGDQGSTTVGNTSAGDDAGDGEDTPAPRSSGGGFAGASVLFLVLGVVVRRRRQAVKTGRSTSNESAHQPADGFLVACQ